MRTLGSTLSSTNSLIRSKGQISVISISSEVMEGAGRGTDSEFRHFLNIAYGSSYELETQLTISNNLNYLPQKDFEELSNQINEIQKMLYSLIQNLQISS